MSMEKGKVKIIATLGPASDKEGTIKRLILNGVNVFRLNFSHGDPEYFSRIVKIVNKLKKKLRKNVSIFVDLPGPKIRTGLLKNAQLEIKQGVKYTLGPGGEIPTTKDIARGISLEKNVLLSDGKIEVKPLKRTRDLVIVRALNDGILLSKQSINSPGLVYKKTYPTHKDTAAIKFGLSHGIDAFALSFVSKKEDILKTRKITGKDSVLIAKIERKEALQNFDEIAEASDVIMIARGDLGLNLDIVQVPFIQRKLIKKANELSKPVITATQMLESMTHGRMPTRAEADDVFTAVMEGTDAVMLSEETAIGAYPVKTVDMLRKLIGFNYRKLSAVEYKIKGEGDALMGGIAGLSGKTGIKTIILDTNDIKNAFRLSRYHIDFNIFVLAKREDINDLLNFGRDIVPIRANTLDTALKYIKNDYAIEKAILVSDTSKDKRSIAKIDILNL